MGAEEAVEPQEKPVVSEAPEPALPPLPQFGAILGSAGTGKTTLIKRYLAARRDVVVTATTGVAALNTGGTTINSRLGYYDLFSLQQAAKSGRLVKSFLSHYYKVIKTWIVDEVSMMGGDQLTILTQAVKDANEILSSKDALYTMVKGHEGNEGGDPSFEHTNYVATDVTSSGYALDDESAAQAKRISLVLVGDFCQLPPVNSPWAFESELWWRYKNHTTFLSTNYRQSNPEFIEALKAARSGHGPGALGYFRSMIHPSRDEAFGGLTIMATNKEVDEENARKLALCTGRVVRFQNHKEGDPKRMGDWKQVPDELVLKLGAKVMILSNYRTREEGLVYINGDMGILIEVDESGLPVVRLERNGVQVQVGEAERDIKVPWDRATEAEREEYREHQEERKEKLKAAIDLGETDLHEAVDEYDRSTVQRTLDLNIKTLESMEAGEEPDFLTVAWMTYTPLRLAYASTVHKCQGLTLDKVQIDLTSGFWTMCPGSLYVALSRARTPEGIRLVGSNEKFLARCRSDWKVRSYV